MGCVCVCVCVSVCLSRTRGSGYTSLGLLQNLKASNEVAKWRLLEYCGSERIYVLLCESRSFTILWLSVCCVLSGQLEVRLIHILY